MATDPYETRSDTPVRGRVQPGQGGDEESDKTVPVPLPAAPPPAGTPGPADTSQDAQRPVEPPPPTSFDVPVAGSPRTPREQAPAPRPEAPAQFALPADSPYAQQPGAYGSQPPSPQGQPQGQSLYETRQDPPRAPQQPAYGQQPPPPVPQQHAQPQPGPYGQPPQTAPYGQPQPQYGQPPVPPQHQQPYGQQPPYAPQQPAAPARPVPPSWHRQHYAIGLFLIVYGVVTLALGLLGFDARKAEAAEYLGDGLAVPVLVAAKAGQAVLLILAATAVVRRRSVLFLPALLAWTAGFAVLCVLDVVSGAFGTLLEHAIYTVAFGLALFLSYAFSVKAGTAAAQAASGDAAPVPAGAPAAPPQAAPQQHAQGQAQQQAAPQSLSRTQEFALNTLNRWQRR